MIIIALFDIDIHIFTVIKFLFTKAHPGKKYPIISPL